MLDLILFQDLDVLEFKDMLNLGVEIIIQVGKA